MAGALSIGAMAALPAGAQKKDTVVVLSKQVPAAKPPVMDTAKVKKVTLAEKTKGSRKIDGLFTVYQDTVTGSVQLFVKKDQLGKEFIYQSFSISGPTSLFLNQSMHRSTNVFKVVRAFDKLEFHEVNTRFYYDPKNAVSRTAGVDVPEAVLLSEKFTVDDSVGYMISADALFLTEKMDPVKPLAPMGVPPGAFFNLGNLNPSKSKYNAIRSFPKNTDIQVDLAYDNPAPYNGGGSDITDARYVRVRMQHSFIEMPENDFQPRFDDPRIGPALRLADVEHLRLHPQRVTNKDGLRELNVFEAQIS